MICCTANLSIQLIHKRFVKICLFILFVYFFVYDRSPLWTMISDAEKSSLGLVFDDDGEFWYVTIAFLQSWCGTHQQLIILAYMSSLCY